ncbi:protein YgfX [Alteromonas sp. D210916BOD_24]|uniref:protein YgfX n=1 Tax=Alteromonas sp. D210916BOD_24 TaxID=3157618 RepID=UPI00399D3488
MSKYRITITHSPYRSLIANLCLIACLGIVLGSLSSAIWTWLDPFILIVVWIGASLLLIHQGVTSARDNTLYPFRYSILLSSNGEIRQITSPSHSTFNVENSRERGAGVGDATLRIHPASQLFPWGIYIAVAKVKDKWFDKSHSHFGWVLRNECSEADYRRLCRAVNCVRKGTHSRN